MLSKKENEMGIEKEEMAIEKENEKHISLGLLKQFATGFKEKIDALLNNKVDKVTGKGLSTNDFTNEYKTKLDNLENVTIDFATTGDIDNIITEVFG